MSADLTCFGLQFGCRSTSSAAAPAMCGEAKLVPSRYANCAPANSTSVDDMICAPGAEMSGLSRWPKSVNPADEKLVGVEPFRCVSTSVMSWPRRIVARPPFFARASCSRAPSRSEIIPAGTPTPGKTFASPGRLSTSTIPIAPALRTLAAFESKVQLPRQTSATAPLSDPAGREDEFGSFGSPDAAHAYRSLDTELMSTRRCDCVAHSSGIAPACTNGIGC